MQSLKITDPIDLQQHEKKDIILRTANFQAIQNVCSDAYLNKKMIAINGEPGYGKTLALEYFKNTNRNCFMITVKPSMTAKTFWLEILQSIYAIEGNTEATEYRPLYFILRRISDSLNRLNNSILIIDEAGKLDERQLAYLHEVRDETKDSSGIVLAGPNYWKVTMQKWLKKNRKGIPEIWRRINYWSELQPPTYFEVKKFCEAYDITDPETIKTLQIRNRNFGGLMNEITELISTKNKVQSITN